MRSGRGLRRARIEDSRFLLWWAVLFCVALLFMLSISNNNKKNNNINATAQGDQKQLISF